MWWQARHVYRQPPSPEVDAAWRALSHDGIIAVGKEEVMRAGKDPEMLVKVPEDWGYGSDKYTAIVDGMHQVHCLDLLRKNLITNYEYYYGSHYNFTPPIFLEVHVNHCLDSLLRDLMCNADEHITFFNWVEGQDGAQPDFAVNRVCRDYQALVDWFDDNMIQDWEHKVQQLHWQPEDKKRPRFDGWKEYTSRKFAGYQGGTPVGALENLPPSCTAK
ncbi:hypothetical protein E8E14_004074 [Neopestalotiopsis sp. 37M]|nr:hypothetical protein E8E14_004074 [Neopestalotiopsis sp. 37M]